MRRVSGDEHAPGAVAGGDEQVRGPHAGVEDLEVDRAADDAPDEVRRVGPVRDDGVEREVLAVPLRDEHAVHRAAEKNVPIRAEPVRLAESGAPEEDLEHPRHRGNCPSRSIPDEPPHRAAVAALVAAR